MNTFSICNYTSMLATDIVNRTKQNAKGSAVCRYIIIICVPHKQSAGNKVPTMYSYTSRLVTNTMDSIKQTAVCYTSISVTNT